MIAVSFAKEIWPAKVNHEEISTWTAILLFPVIAAKEIRSRMADACGGLQASIYLRLFIIVFYSRGHSCAGRSTAPNKVPSIS
jgi:hypothetical protein